MAEREVRNAAVLVFNDLAGRDDLSDPRGQFLRRVLVVRVRVTDDRGWKRADAALVVSHRDQGDEQKAGVAPLDADGFIASLRRNYGFAIEGLMCIPPAEEPAGPHFALLAKIAARNGVTSLSMGMSADYETAVMYGATSVRVGSALFGARG